MTSDARISVRLARYLACAALALLALGMGRSLGAQPASVPAIEARVAELLSQMTLDEKLDMLSGTGFDSKPVPRLGIPALKMADGPVGIRVGESSAFPAGVAMAATWDPALVEELGQALGREARAKGKNVLLAPCVNIHRVPQGGRNFESFGEDPYLAARIAVAYVKGVQSQKVIATLKHFACNNQERERMTIDAKVDERALHEIYLPAFRAAVQEAGAWAVMGAYNRVNGEYACANRTLLTEILKKGWGFPGFVMSDWGAVHGVAPYVNAGLDLEMPGGEFLTKENLKKALAAGEIAESTIDDKIRRMLRAMLAMGLFEAEQDKGALDTPEHRALARRVAVEGTVLLKNFGPLLPIDRKRLRSIAVIGPNAAVAPTGGGGSSYVTPIYTVSPLEAIKKKVGAMVRVNYALGTVSEAEVKPIEPDVLLPPAGSAGGPGLLGEYFDNPDLKGTPVLTRVDKQVAFDWQNDGPAPGFKTDNFSARWTGHLRPALKGRYALAIRSDDGSRLYLDDTLLIDNWGQHGALTRSKVVDLRAGQSYALRLEYSEAVGAATVSLGWQRLAQDPLKTAVRAAEDSDVAVVFAGFTQANESEGADRDGLDLPGGQSDMIAAVAAANPNTIVVLNSGAAVLVDKWARTAAAILEAWYPGEEGGNAIADILFGDESPSGKLPTSFPMRWEDAAAYGHYPGENGVVDYAEGIFVGYRHFDKKALGVAFAFGHGLTYTTFAYRDLRVSPKTFQLGQKVEVSFFLKNTGTREGAEVVQLYLRDQQSSLPRPPKELKSFQRVLLKPGKEKQVRFEIDEKMLAFYNPAKGGWVVEPGMFDAVVGASSADIWLRGSFALE
jgi:beta-glucosidase